MSPAREDPAPLDDGVAVLTVVLGYADEAVADLLGCSVREVVERRRRFARRPAPDCAGRVAEVRAVSTQRGPERLPWEAIGLSAELVLEQVRSARPLRAPRPL